MSTDFILRTIFSALQLYIKAHPIAVLQFQPPQFDKISLTFSSEFPPATAQPSFFLVADNHHQCHEAERFLGNYLIGTYGHLEQADKLLKGLDQLQRLQITTCSCVRVQLEAFGYNGSFLDSICSGNLNASISFKHFVICILFLINPQRSGVAMLA